MTENIKKLVAISSSSIAHALVAIEERLVVEQLVGHLLSLKNGFYAFESALLVRPLSSTNVPSGVIEWNDPSGWKSKFDADLSTETFFAEDVFGEQFSIREKGIVKFNPETGEIVPFAEDIEEWAQKLLKDYAFQTGQSIAHSWQAKHGPLANGCRLAPKVPFVIGGEYMVSNLVSMEDIELVKFNAQIANQITNLSDGSTVKIDLLD